MQTLRTTNPSATNRKPLLLTFAFMGASAAVSFLFLSSSSPLWFLCAILAVCANVGFGASVVAMNTYLPSLARESPEVIEAQKELDKTSESPDVPATTSIDLGDDDDLFTDPESVSAPLLGIATTTTHDHQSPTQKAYVAALSRATSRISSHGIASGYIAGILLLLLALVPVTRLHGSTFSLRLAIGLSGLWWMLFSIPAAIWLPGASVHSYGDGDKWTVRSEIAAGWKRLGVMLRWSQIKRLQHTFRYLAAWFLLSDGASRSHSCPLFTPFPRSISTFFLFFPITLTPPTSFTR